VRKPLAFVVLKPDAEAMAGALKAMGPIAASAKTRALARRRRRRHIPRSAIGKDDEPRARDWRVGETVKPEGSP